MVLPRPERSRRRRARAAGLASSLVAATVLGGVFLAERLTQDAAPTRAQYLAAATAICDRYGKRLDAIPPPNDPAAPGAVYESIGLALPLLRAQAARVRELIPPAPLRVRVDRFLLLSETSLDHLARARRHAGRRELFAMVRALAAFERTRDDAKRAGRSIGFRC